MMPKRIAEQAIGQPITDMTGSGPFKIVEFAGREDRLRQEHRLRAPQGTRQRLAGGKVVNVDKVEWNVMPDA